MTSTQTTTHLHTIGAVRAHDSQTAVLDTVETPTPGPGQLRVRVRAAAINPADLMIDRGVLQAAFSLTGTLGVGYDFAGEVTAVGEGVTGFSVGDRVSGLASDVSAGLRSHAEQVVVGVAEVAHTPELLDDTAAATFPLNALTARQSLDLLGAPSGRLLITGAAGGVGGFAVRLGADRGWPVVALARETDADFVLAAGATELVTELVTGPTSEATSRYEAVLDAAVLGDAAVAAVIDGGRYVGVMPPAPPASTRGVDVQSVAVHPDAAALVELLDAAAQGRLATRVAAEFDLTDFRAAYDRAATSTRGRVILHP